MINIFSKPTIQFCESNLDGLIAQPANTWSNLGFILIAFYLFFISSKSKNLLLKTFSLIVFLIGIMSFIYHASYTFIGQLTDLSSMFLLSSYLIIFNLYRLKKYRQINLIFLYVLLVLISTFAVYYFRTINGFNIGIPIFASQIIIALILEVILYKNIKNYQLKYLLLAFFTLIVAQIIWWVDYLKIWCNPLQFHLINGHAIWHVLSAIILLFVFCFYRQFEELKG